jgi:hypothetical protein
MSEENVETLNDDRAPEHEDCGVINELEESSPRGSFAGLIKDAPGCGTMVANTLSQQSIHEVNVLLEEATGSKSDLLVSFDTLNVSLGSAAYPYLQPPAVEALQKAIRDRGTMMVVNSAYRALAQQFLLYNWWTNGVCAFQAVARPGASYHQAGMAIDIEDTDRWRPYLERYGWQWFGPGDYPHFTYVGGGQVESVKIKGSTIDIRNTATLAFQRLWNRNNSGAQIAEDGGYGPNTESKLRVSPANGFKIAPWDKKPRSLRLSQPRMEGSDVERLQTVLKKAGITVDVDGEFGPGTDKAVKEFQAKKTLAADGIVGPKTIAALA